MIAKIKIFFKNYYLVILIALASSIVVYIQSGRTVILLDYTYQIEGAYRVYLGQVPYTDFIVSMAPGTWFISAILMKIFGPYHMVLTYYSMLVSAIIVFLTYSILNRIIKDSNLNIFLILLLMVTGHAIIPFPNYDINATVLMLLSIYLLIKIIQEDKKGIYPFILGILLTLPSFFKQNIGLAFTAITFFVLFFISISSKDEFNFKKFFISLSGAVLSYSIFILYFVKNGALNDFIFQLYLRPSQTSSILGGYKMVFTEYISRDSLLFCLTFVISFTVSYFQKISKKIKEKALTISIIITMVLVPLSIFIFLLFVNKDLTKIYTYYISVYNYYFSVWNLVIILSMVFFVKDIINFRKGITFLKLFPIILIATAITSFIAHGKLGSSFGIWPLFLIMISSLIKKMNSISKKADIGIDMNKSVKIMALVLTLIFTIYVVNNGFAKKFVPTEGPLQKATATNIKGLALQGNLIQEMEEMFDFVENNIPKKDKIATIPGEDPFYIATEREPATSYLILGNIYFPYNMNWIFKEYIDKGVKWIIVKDYMQPFGRDSFNFEKLIKKVQERYTLYKKLDGYDVYLLKT